MSLDRTIVLVGEQQAAAAAALIASNWRPMADAEHPLAIRLYEHKDDATREQRALLWIRYGEIAAQAWVGGRQFSDEVWHEFFKREFLPDETGPSKRCRKGYRKWDYLPNGEKALVGSTELLTTFGKAEYLEQVMAYGATEFGVRYAPTPREMAAMRGTV